MTTRHLLLAALLAGLFAPALAEETRAAPSARADAPDHEARGGAGAPRGIVVKNLPYSAVAVTEQTQMLADGNQIASRRTTTTYRDSAGRTRQEYHDAKGDLVTVTITDPVAAVNLVLDPRNHTATKIDVGAMVARAAANYARARAGQAPHADDGDAIIVKRVEDASDVERRRIRRDVRIQVSMAQGGYGNRPRDMRIPMMPLMNGVFADVKWAMKATTRDLGTRDFSGIKAEGKLRSYEIPVGEIGNRNPIVVSDETWTAPDLQVAVYTKHSDPRSGDIVFRLENVKREEPPAALFTVPADYTVTEAGVRWHDRGGHAGK